MKGDLSSARGQGVVRIVREPRFASEREGGENDFDEGRLRGVFRRYLRAEVTYDENSSIVLQDTNQESAQKNSSRNAL